MKKLAYIRRSRQDLEKERITGEDTLAEQRRILERLVSDQIIGYVEWYSEIASGDKIIDRPVFQQVLELIETEEYDSIIVKEISRLGRGDMEDAGRIMKILKRHSVLIVTPYRTFDINNPMDARYIRFELFMAREEFEFIRERFVSAKHSGALEGRVVCGKAPFGYKKDSRTRKLIINEDEIEVVQLIYRMVLEDNLSVTAVTTKLNSLGIKPPGKSRVGPIPFWNVHTVSRMLSNPVYSGTMVSGRRRLIEGVEIRQPVEKWITVPNSHPAIIPLEDFEKVQAILKIKRPPVPWDATPKRLAGLIKCAKCGHAMIYQNYNNGNGYALCKNRCKHSHVSYRLLEEHLLSYLKDVIINPSLVEEKILFLNQSNTGCVFSFDTLAQQLESEVDRAKTQLYFIFEQYENGVYDADTFAVRRKTQEEKIEKLQTNIENVKIENNPEKIIRQQVEEYSHAAASVLDYYQNAIDDKERNLLLKKVIWKALFYREKKWEPFELDIYPLIQ